MRPHDAKKLLELLWPDLVQIDGLYLLASEIPGDGVKLSDFADRTDAEAFYNHVHILDLCEHDSDLDGDDPEGVFFDVAHPDFIAACELGRLVASMWQAKLAYAFQGLPFRIYFTAEDNPIVRFHHVRSSEPVWLDEATWSTQIADGRVVVLTTDAIPKVRHN